MGRVRADSRGEGSGPWRDAARPDHERRVWCWPDPLGRPLVCGNRRFRAHGGVRASSWIGEAVQAVARRYGVCADVLGFERDMPARVAAAHVVVGKAGGLTVSEALTAGRPMVLQAPCRATRRSTPSSSWVAGPGWCRGRGRSGPSSTRCARRPQSHEWDETRARLCTRARRRAWWTRASGGAQSPGARRHAQGRRVAPLTPRVGARASPWATYPRVMSPGPRLGSVPPRQR